MAILLANTTLAVASDAFVVNTDRPTFIASGTYVDGEDATLQILSEGTWVNVIIEGTTQVLDEQNTVLTIYGRGTYRFNKDATSSAAGVVITGV